MAADPPKSVEISRQDKSDYQQSQESGKEGEVNTEPLPLPPALRDQELSEADFDTLSRIAEGDGTEPGLLSWAPKKVPVRDKEAARG